MIKCIRYEQNVRRSLSSKRAVMKVITIFQKNIYAFPRVAVMKLTDVNNTRGCRYDESGRYEHSWLF